MFQVSPDQVLDVDDNGGVQPVPCCRLLGVGTCRTSLEVDVLARHGRFRRNLQQVVFFDWFARFPEDQPHDALYPGSPLFFLEAGEVDDPTARESHLLVRIAVLKILHFQRSCDVM